MASHWGVSELAHHLDVSRQIAWRLTRRNHFPEPELRLAMGPLWRREQVIQWIREHRPVARPMSER